ncbi:hypothetical protein D7Y41_32525 [Anaerotruncus sp. 1XD22-93]|nr:hypothetical protein D7Y41_32525 [Anaerotruncus sp. 1XD22-93]
MVKTEKTTKTPTAAKTTMATKTGEFLPEEDRKLSGSEAMVMKAVWDAGEDISVPDLMIALKEKYGKDYARTTVQTFLLKMIGKGFVQIYRRGKLSYVHALKGEADYKAKLLQEEMDFWYQGDPAQLVASLFRAGEMTEEDKEQIRRALDGLDD